MIRNTRQRQAILETFEALDRPLTPQEVLVQASRTKPGMGLTTVYRAIKDLLLEGALVAVDVLGEPPRYERAGKAHHHHFVCNACTRVFEMAMNG